MWMDVTGKSNPEESPYHKSTSNDIDWIASVKMQAGAQKWVDHSISKTCNLPKNATKELVADVYMKAWEENCKGFTVYRDGCRSGVLLSDDSSSKQAKFEEHQCPKRPGELECDIHQATIKGESWTIFVGKLENKPYEIFGGLSKFVEIPKKIKHAKILKHSTKKHNGSSLYNLFYFDGEKEHTIEDIVSAFENPTEGAFTRTLSLALRHGAPVQYMVEQLQKDDKDSDMYSFSRVIGRVLKHYIKDGATSGSCPNCSAAKMMYKEGCSTCPNCGYSKCG
jgi:ribonucleoside-diphosphate reductase alpha chain